VFHSKWPASTPVGRLDADPGHLLWNTFLRGLAAHVGDEHQLVAQRRMREQLRHHPGDGQDRAQPGARTR
jgi:hypothetical protein